MSSVSAHDQSAEPEVATVVRQGPDLVSVIIVNYNGMRFLQPCIDSLHRSFSGHRYELVIVDNCSTDGSREWLAQRSDIVYVESTENLGFTGGNNLGASLARGDRFLFINNDTLVESSLDPLIRALSASDVGVVGCRLIYGDGRQQFSFGYDHTPLRIVLSWLGLEKRHGLPTWFRRMETDPKRYQVAQPSVAWVSGACFAMRRADWEQLGGFDTRFFMYCEDVDLCVRVRQLGKRVQYLPEVRVTHYEGAGRVWIGKAALMRTVNSYMLFCSKHYGGLSCRFMSLALGSLFVSRSLAFWMLGCISAARRAVMQDKSTAFRAAGIRLWRNAPVAGLV